MRALLVVMIMSVTAACATSAQRNSSVPVTALLSGDSLGLTPPPEPITRADAMAVDADMRAFVAAAVGQTSQYDLVVARLINALKEQGFFNLEYVVGDTRTARETFHARRGNCISFTMLFVALARASGLRVAYQIVDVPPVWNADSELTVIANHINALIETATGREYVVDFNETSFDSHHARRKISDARAMALFFNNLGAEAMLRQDYAAALHYFQEAIAADAEAPDAWVNLGMLYVRHERLDYAEAAYLRALSIDPWQRSALTNLANLYHKRGDSGLARGYEERIRRYQRRNPYYHFIQARQSFAAGRFDDALESLQRSIRLKHDAHDFHYLLAMTQIQLGELERAAESLTRARRYALTSEAKAKYDEALADLRRAQTDQLGSSARAKQARAAAKL